MAFVLDCSITLSWYFRDEGSVQTDALLERLIDEEIFVPALWPLEVTNALLAALRRNRIDETELAGLLGDLRDLPSEIDSETDVMVWDHSLALARRYGLSVYDATYLELAIRKEVPLATVDRALARAADEAGVGMPG